MNLGGLARARFTLLEANQNEMIIGLIGQFWKPNGNLQSFNPEEFLDYESPGFSKATWSFKLKSLDQTSILETETRIYCTDEKSRRRFRRYWFFIKPFSGVIRMEILRGIKAKAEKA